MTQIHQFFSLSFCIASGDGRGSGRGVVGLGVPGGAVALDGGIGVGVEACGLSDGAPVVHDLQGARRRAWGS